MDDLVVWLTAQLDEDERLARAAADNDGGRWFVGNRWNIYRAEDSTPHEDYETNDLVAWGNVKPQSDHIAHWDPARVLAEVKAKRAILALRAPLVEMYDSYLAVDGGAVTVIEDVIRALALPYRDRPYYRPEWAPRSSPTPGREGP